MTRPPNWWSKALHLLPISAGRHQNGDRRVKFNKKWSTGCYQKKVRTATPLKLYTPEKTEERARRNLCERHGQEPRSGETAGDDQGDT